jgi:uncharacterized protein DUF6602
MRKLLYGDFVRTIATTFDQALQNIAVEHNFELGDEFEVPLCKILRKVLPQKFGICRGYAINRDGDVAGDDIIIYERMRFPTARLIDDDWSLKQRVPIEAVLAYIEAKHSLTLEGDGGQSLLKALAQAAAVKALCNQREEVPLRQVAHGFHLAEGIFQINQVDGWPTIRNPVYSAVISRYVRIKAGEPVISDPQTIRTEIIARPQQNMTEVPDMICAGASVIALPAKISAPDVRLLIPFAVGAPIDMPVAVTENIAFGIAIAHLMWALDYIELGAMPWAPIISDALK